MEKKKIQTIVPILQVEYVVNEDTKSYNIGARYSSLLEELAEKDPNGFNAVISVLKKTLLDVEAKVGRLENGNNEETR